MVMARVVRLVVITILSLASLAHARQTGTLIADLVDYPEVRAVIPASLPSTFARVFSPPADQRAAADRLIAGAREEVARIINRHLRTVRDDPTLDQMRESESRVLKEVGEVERQLLSDLRSILSREQDPLYPAFERAHRRSLIGLVNPQPLPIDLWRFFEANRFDPPSDASLAALLDTFDRESDGALVRQRRALKAYFDNIRKGSDASDEGTKRDRRLQRELFEANANLERVHASVIEPLLARLPAPLGDRLVAEAIGALSSGFDRTVSAPRNYPVVREVLSLKLSKEQIERARALIEEAEKAAIENARVCLIDQARFILQDNEGRAKYPTAPLNLYWEKASKLRVRLSNELLALLTPAQRAAYDASPVIEPSTSSIVKDE